MSIPISKIDPPSWTALRKYRGERDKNERRTLFEGTMPMTSDVRSHYARRLAVLSAAILFVATLAPSPSWGAPVTVTTPAETASIPSTQTDWQPGVPSTLADPVSIAKFNPSLGTLTSVNFALNYTLQNNFSMTFTAPSTITVGAVNTSITVDRPSGSSIIAAFPADVTKSDTVASGFPNTVTFPTVSSSGSATPLSLTNATDLALFTATTPGQTIALPIIASAHSSFSSSTGNGSGAVLTDAARR